MNNLDYFKKQAKYLVNDWKTRKEKPEVDDDWEGEPYVYEGKYFDMYNVVHFFGIGDDFGLQKAQHIIAQMAGFKKWEDLKKANEDELSLARIRFLHLDPTIAEGWDKYCKLLNWNLIPIGARFPIIKNRLYNTKSDFLLNSQFVNEILYGKEREVAMLNELQVFPYRSDPEALVECMHCGRQFPNKEVTVIHEYEFGLIGEHDSISCKFYPECDGTLIDLMGIKDMEGN